MTVQKKIEAAVFILGWVLILSFPTMAFAEEKEDERVVFPGVKDEIMETLGIGRRAMLRAEKVIRVSGTTLTIDKNGKVITVLTDEATKIRRRFFGAGSLSEVLVNDTVNVSGRWVDDDRTQIQASLVRDLSIQKRRGVFMGTISNLNGNSFSLNSVSRGRQTVTVDPRTTKFINRTGRSINFNAIRNGQRVRVRGLWDRINHTITEVTQVKDFSIPS